MSHSLITPKQAALFCFRKTGGLFLIMVLLFNCICSAQVLHKEDLSPYYETINNIYKNRRVDRIYSRDIFDFSTEIRPMKKFFIENASRALNPKALACINTVRAGMETLIYGNSSIPYSKFYASGRPLFRISGANRVIDLMKTLSVAGCINDYKDVYFLGRNLRGDTVVINENNFKDSLQILTTAGSVWYAILSMLPRVKGWSVFCISLSNGYHTATLAVNHNNFQHIEMYWADQTQHHPVFEKDRLPDIAVPQFGWERMMENSGPDQRSLDDYCLYAVRQFMNSDPAEEGNRPVGSKRHMPIVRIWKISKPPQQMVAISEKPVPKGKAVKVGK